MKLSKIILILPVLTLLFACAENQNSQKQNIGTILGAGLGALAGAQLGKGKGKLVTVALGTLGGAFAGSELGRALDDLDRLKAKQAQRDSLENNKDGVSSTWTNPNTGNSGKITPKRTEQMASGEFCREYEHEINVADKMETVKGTACRQPDGTWRVIN